MVLFGPPPNQVLSRVNIHYLLNISIFSVLGRGGRWGGVGAGKSPGVGEEKVDDKGEA